MGNEPTKKPQYQICISQVQRSGTQDLMFQSRLSGASYETKLLKKTIRFNPGSDNINNYLQRLSILGQHIQSENLMLPVYCYVREASGMCTHDKQLQVKITTSRSIIRPITYISKKKYSQGKNIFKNSAKIKQIFLIQVWYLLYSVLNACRKFQGYKIKSGPLKTSNIVLNERGHVKVKNILTQPQQKQQQQLFNYFSPEQLQAMREKRSFKYHQNVCQTYTIAIIVIQVCTFIDGQAFYDMQRMKINQNLIGKALDIVQKYKYSKLLVNLLKIMLSNYEDRPLPSQIYQTFKPYQAQIQSLQSFKFDPNKMYQSLQTSQASIVY